MTQKDEMKQLELDAREQAAKDDIEQIAETLGMNKASFVSRPKMKLSRKEKKKVVRDLENQMKAVKSEVKSLKSQEKEANVVRNKKTKSISAQLKERDKSIADTTKNQRKKHSEAKNTIDFIGYKRMFKNGICEVEEGIFSQTIAFTDISYQSARDDYQKATFDTMCNIYDYLSTSVSLQFNIVNTKLNNYEIGNREFFDVRKQQTEVAREDAKIFNEILNNKMKEGVSNLNRERYVTFAITAPDLDEALPKLARIRKDLMECLGRLGCRTEVLNGWQRLKIIHETLNPEQPFDFDYDRDISLASGMTTKDYLSPSAIDFKPLGECGCFKTDDKWGQVLVFKDVGSELNDRVISDIVDLPIPMNVTWYAQAWERSEAIRFVKLRAGWIDAEIVKEQQKSANKGQDFTVLSPEVQHNKDEVMDLLDHLLNKNQNLYTFTGLVYVYADSKEELDERVMQIIDISRTKGVNISLLEYRQREGLNSIFPLANNYVDINRIFTTAQMAIFIPFATQEMDDEGGNYAGQNKHSNNLVVVNRKKLMSPVGFICGKTGSGKSFFVKQEIEGTILNNPTDQIIIFDRAGEYTMLTQHHNGTVFKFDVNSNTYLNPFDISQDKEQSIEQQITNKIDAMIAQSSAAAADAGVGLSEEDQSIIARCVDSAFLEAQDREPGSVPLLEDFHRILNQQPEPSAKKIALRHERFVEGTMAFFNRHSNVDWSNRIIDINIKDLPDNMLIFCLITMCESARNQMYRNSEIGRRTWIYIEEIQSMFKYPPVLNYFSRFANEARKFGGLLTGITQNSTSMLTNEDAKPIVLNADFIMLLKQSPTDREAWCDMLGLSEQEAGFIDETTDKGAGLLCAGANRIPIIGGFPKGNTLYDIFSTDPNEIEDAKAKERLKINATSHLREQGIIGG